jgi:hypothetical protein
MGFMDKAKKFAEQAKDGTLKERAKALADQAQGKLDEVQDQSNDKQQAGAAAPPAEPAAAARPVPPEAVEAVQAAAGGTPAAAEPTAAEPPPSPPSDDAGAVDRSHEAPPKLTGGDPLAG